MRDVAQAIENCELNPDKVVIVSGIGCSSRAAGYMNYNTLHTTTAEHRVCDRCEACKSELHVIVITDDGGATAIGGNHLIHACRRNIDLTVVVFNNNIYGMTGGQYSPTTPHGEKERPHLTAISTITLTFRSWRRPQVRPTPPEAVPSMCRNDTLD